MTPGTPPDWHLREWMEHFGKRQSSLVNELGWTKGRANYTWHGDHPYRRETVNEIAAWLGIAPYELLMPPDEALRLRMLKDAFVAIAAETGSKYEHDGPVMAPPSGPKRTGTRG